jgi:uncharacterized membrane protein YkoI
MKKINLINAALLLCTIAMSAFAYKGENLAKNAKITLEQARSIAVKKYPGTVIEEELRKGESCNRLSYSFRIQDRSTVQRVCIDAQSGDVLRFRIEDYKGK